MKTPITMNDLTDEMIARLRDEAGAHGDLETVALCDAAFDGEITAKIAVLGTINDARAQD